MRFNKPINATAAITFKNITAMYTKYQEMEFEKKYLRKYIQSHNWKIDRTRA